MPAATSVPGFPDRALARAGDAVAITGNTVTLLRDGPQVFPAWLADIAAARRFVLFENYIINNDRIGNQIADALCERAQAGVAVYLLYDWFGCIGTSRKLWRRLTQAGVEVRAFNPPLLTSPLSGLRRDHRKSLSIDGAVGYVAGLCVGDDWAGDAGRHIPAWRDTAVRIAGPAVAALMRAFDETWSLYGPPLPDAILTAAPAPPADSPGDRPLLGPSPSALALPSVRVVSGLPGRSRIYRLTSVLLAAATRRIWITDAYFLTPPALYESLLAAARDGIDVRVMVPGRSDLPWVSWMGRSGYAGLLAAGVRIFEWEGPMLHAKTSVIDGRWSRVGSSNLNLASLMTNWELDVLVEDPAFATVMEDMFLADQQNASELVLRRARFRAKIQRADPARSDDAETVVASAQQGSAPSLDERRSASLRAIDSLPAGAETDGERAFRQQKAGDRRRAHAAPTGRAGAAVARASAAVLGVALRRQFEQSAWSVSGVSAVLLVALGALSLWRPAIVGLPLGALLLWLGIAALGQAISQWRQRDRARHPRPRHRPRLRLPFRRHTVPDRSDRRDRRDPEDRGDRPASYLQQAKGITVSQDLPPPHQLEPK